MRGEHWCEKLGYQSLKMRQRLRGRRRRGSDRCGAETQPVRSVNKKEGALLAAGLNAGAHSRATRRHDATNRAPQKARPHRELARAVSVSPVDPQDEPLRASRPLPTPPVFSAMTHVPDKSRILEKSRQNKITNPANESPTLPRARGLHPAGALARTHQKNHNLPLHYDN